MISSISSPISLNLLGPKLLSNFKITIGGDPAQTDRAFLDKFQGKREEWLSVVKNHNPRNGEVH